MSGFSFVEWSDVFCCVRVIVLYFVCLLGSYCTEEKKHNLTHKTAVQCNVELYPDSVLILLFCFFLYFCIGLRFCAVLKLIKMHECKHIERCKGLNKLKVFFVSRHAERVIRIYTRPLPFSLALS